MEQQITIKEEPQSLNYNDSCFEEMRDQVQSLGSFLEEKNDTLIRNYQGDKGKYTYSSKSSSFLTTPNNDASSICINEKYRENVVRGKESCIHIKEPLLRIIPKKSRCNCMKRIKRLFIKKNALQSRKVFLDKIHISQNKGVDQQINGKPISNCRYSLLTFIPLALFNRLKQFTNLFLFLVGISQFIENFKVGLLYSYLSPLFFLLLFFLVREAYDDIKRYIADKQNSSNQVSVLQPKGAVQNVCFGDLKVGDVVELKKGEIAPADMIILCHIDEEKVIFADSSNLEGKSLFSKKEPFGWFQREMNARDYNNTDMGWLLEVDGCFEIPPPSDNIEYFKDATFHLTKGYSKLTTKVEIDNVLWAGCSLSSQIAYGLIIYTGNECKRNLNRDTPSFKISKADKEARNITIILFLVIFLQTIFIITLKGNQLSSLGLFFDFMRYFILLCSIIPGTLRLNLEIMKLIACVQIKRDATLKTVEISDKNIPEELGRIEILLCDKTGTMTQNEMSVSKICLEQTTYSAEDMMEMESIIINQCNKHSLPISSLMSVIENQEDLMKARTLKEKEQIFRDLITAMAVCNNVVVSNNYDSEYFGVSPDEIACVKLSEQLRIILESRNDQYLSIKNCKENIDTFEILANIPYSPNLKRSGILLRHTQSQKIILFAKGQADYMKNIIYDSEEDPSTRKFIEDESINIGSQGLRPLVFCQQLISEQQYESYIRNANQQNEGTDVLLNILMEGEMDLLGIIGIETKLKDGIEMTMESLCLAGISVWIVTGDGIEQTMSVAVQSGIQKKDQYFHCIKAVTDDIDIKAKLQHIDNEKNSKKQILIIDGQSLSIAIQFAEELLIHVCKSAASVLFCKCSAEQKKQIVQLIKKYTNIRVAAIGDGINDVSMIQEAHLGIGLTQEGQQTEASLAADLIIPDMYSLNQLLLYHGRLAYKRSVLVSSFVMQRGLVISFVEFIFIGVFYTISLQIFNGKLLLCYASLFTVFPSLTLAFSQDVDMQTCIDFPQLYKAALKGRFLNVRTFFTWLWKAVFQSTVLMMLIFTWFSRDYFLNIETYVFFSLVLFEYLQLLQKLPQRKKIGWLQIGMLAASIFTYILILYFFQDLFEIGNIWNLQKIGMLFGIVLICWLPLFGMHLMRLRIEPTDDEKILRRAVSTEQNK